MTIKKDSEKSTETPTLEEQNSNLQKQLNEMRLMMEQFMNSKVEKEVEKNTDEIFSYDEELKIDPYKMVTIVSLTNGGLNLKSPKGNKHLRDFGATTRVTFEDLHAIVENHREFASEGGFLIQDEASVKALYLTEEYSHLISKDRIEKFIDLPIKEIIPALRALPKTIQETILQKVITGISTRDNRYSDLNKIEVLNEYTGKNLQEIAKQIAE